MYPQENNSSAKLIKAKIAFEQFAQSCGVKNMHYHADNRRFADNVFIKDVQDQRQSVSYWGSTHTIKMVRWRKESETCRFKAG